MSAKIRQGVSYVLSANELLSGDVVFWNANGGWSTGIDAAQVLHTQDKAFVALGEAKKDEQANTIIGAELVEVTVSDEGIRPVHIRERIRALGPTVRADLARSARGFQINAVEERP